ncbi:MAG: glycosyltransferase family 4 protein [Actinomycetota bacterium]|nr:glycosyltransferase family 4 protein [Actinomycetota bacterium]MDA3003569.1 glycosyltransferase family 4 protein [Actinomycetota bacterium]
MSKKLRLIVLCPHFEPDMAPTGVVMTRIVHELAARGHELHVVTSLPWYRKHQVESGWAGALWRVEKTNWGSISRVQPFAGKTKSNLVRRAVGFVLFSYFVGLRALFTGRFWRRVDGVLAMSPPLTLGLIGWHTKLFRGGKLVFNIQDVFPDAAIETGAISNQRVIATASWLERVSYQRSDSVVLLSDDLANNVQRKLEQKFHKRIKVIPNFVDTQAIVPMSRLTNYRRELGIDESLVVMYAGNVGFSQSLELLLEAARVLPEVMFVINGEGAARNSLEAKASTLNNVKFGDYQDVSRLSEVLATGDLHVVPLRRGLGSVSVPSKTYSILAAGRPICAAIDLDTEVPRILAAAKAGVCVEPDNQQAFVSAISAMTLDRKNLEEMGANGRKWVEGHASPQSVAQRYEALYMR